MAVDYDAVKGLDDSTDESILSLKRTIATTPVESTEITNEDTIFLTDFDFPDREMSVTVTSQLKYEFTCSKCFIVHHKNAQAGGTKKAPICNECI